MSQTLTIDALAVFLQTRMPMNLPQARCFQELNSAWRKIEQQGAFVWNILSTSITMTGGTRVLALPADVDPGKPISIYQSGVTFRYPVKYLPFEEFAMQQLFHLNPSPNLGYFSAWTIINTGTNSYQASFVPNSAAPSGNTPFTVFYHHMVGPPLTSGQFFPTPDEFDDTLMDLAEGEIRRAYSLMNWEASIKESETAMRLLVDKYRSPREHLAGVQEESMAANEGAIDRAK